MFARLNMKKKERVSHGSFMYAINKVKEDLQYHMLNIKGRL
jgi:hypothetical protein